MEPLIRLAGATKDYGPQARALHPTDLALPQGELVAIFGPSGSGKTTLLNLVGGLDRPSAGEVHVDGVALSGLSDAALGEFRRAHVGFVFQFFNLVPSLTAAENVALAAELAGVSCDPAALLSAVGLAGLDDRFPAEMSGGQQQRVAIARALAKKPAVLLCDEPTGALDQGTGAAVLDLLARSKAENGQTVLVVTHDPKVAGWADRVVRIQDGRVASVEGRAERAPEGGVA